MQSITVVAVKMRLFVGISLIVLFSYVTGFVLGSFFNGFPDAAGPAVGGHPALSPLPNAVLPSLLPANKLEASAYIAAVDSKGNGVLNKASVEIIDGKGRVLFNTNPFVEPDTQASLETAARVAFDFTKTSMAGKDVIFSVDDTPAQLIGGPSAGAAFTVTTIAAIEGKQLKGGVAMTGTIEPDGSIGPVGGLVEKATAAFQKGEKLFLVPKGQGTITFYKQVVSREQRGYLTIQRVQYVPQTLNLNDYAKENLFGMEIKEVANISEAVGYFIE